MGGMMSARGAANFLTRTTAVLAAIFMGLCLMLPLCLDARQKHRPFWKKHQATRHLPAAHLTTHKSFIPERLAVAKRTIFGIQGKGT